MRAFAVAAGAVALTLGLAGAGAAAPADSVRVLFVGNSLTATNDLPRMVEALARASGRRAETRSVTFGGFSLEDQWNAGPARDAVAAGGWDVVVLQQGPSALPESQVNLREWARRFADAARAAGERTALLTVWPESYRQSALTDVIASYRNAAVAARATVLPAGGAWQAAWRCDPRLPLYGPDGFHPSPLGTYTAALAVYGRLFAAPLRGLPAALGPYGADVTVTPAQARLAQWAAARALGRRPAPPACGR